MNNEERITPIGRIHSITTYLYQVSITHILGRNSDLIYASSPITIILKHLLYHSVTPFALMLKTLRPGNWYIVYGKYYLKIHIFMKFTWLKFMRPTRVSAALIVNQYFVWVNTRECIANLNVLFKFMTNICENNFTFFFFKSRDDTCDFIKHNIETWQIM